MAAVRRGRNTCDSVCSDGIGSSLGGFVLRALLEGLVGDESTWGSTSEVLVFRFRSNLGGSSVTGGDSPFFLRLPLTDFSVFLAGKGDELNATGR